MVEWWIESMKALLPFTSLFCDPALEFTESTVELPYIGGAV